MHHKQYNADLASGKAQAWAEANPGYSNPELVKAKQEELDTYGITNEQTRDKNFLERRGLINLDPYGEYNAKQGVNALLLNNSYERIHDPYSYKVPEDMIGNLLGRPMKNNTLRISPYRPTDGAKQDYYYEFNRNPYGDRAHQQKLEELRQIRDNSSGNDYSRNANNVKEHILNKSLETDPYVGFADAPDRLNELPLMERPMNKTQTGHISRAAGAETHLGYFTRSKGNGYDAYYDQ